MTTRDDIAKLIESNLARAEANLAQVSWDAINADLDAVKAHPWRLIRNRRLLNRCRRARARNWELLNANTLLFAENSALLALSRSRALP